MPSAPALSLKQRLGELDLRRSPLLFGLMLASGLTEGVGLVLVVPLLAVVGGSGEQGRLATWLVGWGVPLRLGPLLAILVGLVLLRAILQHLQEIERFKLETRVVDRLRERAWRALSVCDWREFASQRPSDVISLMVNNVDRIGEAINLGAGFLSLSLTLAGVTAAALVLSPTVTLVAVVCGALALAAYGRMRRRAERLGELANAAYQQIHGQLSDGLRAGRTIRIYGMQQRVADEGMAAFSGLRRYELAYLRDIGLGRLALQGGGAVVLAGVLWLALERWKLPVDAILPMVVLYLRGLPLLGEVQQHWQGWKHCATAIDETLRLIHHAEAHREPHGTAPPPPLEQAIRFEQVAVRFASADRPALPPISLTIGAREMVALIGPSGSGKSTLADLGGGLLSPDQGVITIDGVPLTGELRQAWRSRVAYVEQDTAFLAGTVRENLLWAQPSADATGIDQALSDAAAEFVHDWPDGLDTRLGEGGRRLSGGEAQRLSLARAFLHQPALLILDEPTSALDAANEAAIVSALERVKGRFAILVVAHRGALIGLCDKVVELPQFAGAAAESFG